MAYYNQQLNNKLSNWIRKHIFKSEGALLNDPDIKKRGIGKSVPKFGKYYELLYNLTWIFVVVYSVLLPFLVVFSLVYLHEWYLLSNPPTAEVVLASPVRYLVLVPLFFYSLIGNILVFKFVVTKISKSFANYLIFREIYQQQLTEMGRGEKGFNFGLINKEAKEIKEEILATVDLAKARQKRLETDKQVLKRIWLPFTLVSLLFFIPFGFGQKFNYDKITTISWFREDKVYGWKDINRLDFQHELDFDKDDNEYNFDLDLTIYFNDGQINNVLGGRAKGNKDYRLALLEMFTTHKTKITAKDLSAQELAVLQQKSVKEQLKYKAYFDQLFRAGAVISTNYKTLGQEKSNGEEPAKQVNYFSQDDPIFKEAVKKAQASLPKLKAVVSSAEYTQTKMALVYRPFTVEKEIVYFWVMVNSYEGKIINGNIINERGLYTENESVKHGSEVTFPDKQIADWVVIDKTGQILLGDYLNSEIKEFK